jgi:hypothetical protein
VASFLHPVGPLPPSVYWRRRAIVLGVPLVLILAVAYSCSGSGSKPAAHTSATTPPTGTPSTGAGVIQPSVMPTGTPGPVNNYPPVGPSSGAAGGGPSASSGAGPGSSPGSGPTGSSGTSSGTPAGCALSLTLTLDRSAQDGSVTYPAGQDPDFVVTAKNSGAGNCVLDVSGKGIVITVTEPAAGSGSVWTSSTCATSTDRRALGPGDSYQATTVWQRTWSEAGCPQKPPSAGTGTFVVTATANGVSAASVQFVLQ